MLTIGCWFWNRTSFLAAIKVREAYPVARFIDQADRIYVR